jgi:hypothetical protein
MVRSRSDASHHSGEQNPDAQALPLHDEAMAKCGVYQRFANDIHRHRRRHERDLQLTAPPSRQTQRWS